MLRHAMRIILAAVEKKTVFMLGTHITGALLRLLQARESQFSTSGAR
jgi:hypothetical protein